VEVDSVATPPDVKAVPSVVPSLVNVTVSPFGTVPDCDVTIAVNVTD
jgi:hypothetical protein